MIPKGIDLIQTERLRQIKVEGWTPEHDDSHLYGVLAVAAYCYFGASDAKAKRGPNWPWDKSWWKPKSRIKNLIRAGALYMAEESRLKRANKLCDDMSMRVKDVANAIDAYLKEHPDAYPIH